MSNDILNGLEFVPDGGALMFKDVRYLLIRPETIVEIQKALDEEMGSERAGQVFYRAGHRGGSLSSKKFREDFNLDPVDIVRFMAKMGGQIGWGRMEIEKVDPRSGVL
jgi:predicted hydrocarbon binding protein